MSIAARIKALEAANMLKSAVQRIDQVTNWLIGGKHGFLSVPKQITETEWVEEVEKYRQECTKFDARAPN